MRKLLTMSVLIIREHSNSITVIVDRNDEESMVTLELSPEKETKKCQKSLKFSHALHNFSKMIQNETQ